MVLINQTPAIVSALQRYAEINNVDVVFKRNGDDPALSDAAVGKPISHGQVIDLFNALKDKAVKHAPPPSNHEDDAISSFKQDYPRLPDLLRGARIYTAPTPVKVPPSSEYQLLMTRLRREAEQVEYRRMTGSPGEHVSANLRGNPFAKFVGASTADAWDLGGHKDHDQDEGSSLREINAQISVIINVLVSIVACGGAFFLLLRYANWSNEVRALASMFGALVVGVAEVVVYSGFIRRKEEAKKSDEKQSNKEVRSIQQTWVIGGETRKQDRAALHSTAKEGSGIESIALGSLQGSTSSSIAPRSVKSRRRHAQAESDL